MKRLPLFVLFSAVAASAFGAELSVNLAFPNLTFDKPLYFGAVPDGSSRIVVLEQDGRVRWFENRADVRDAPVALDISRRVLREHMEEGLLGFAFHPKFAENHFVFLQYSAGNPRRNVISRFEMGAAGSIAEISEKVILEVEQPYANHNGGNLAFGPDGFLYIGLGDGGSGGDPHNNAQNKGTLLGKMLRIDVDHAEEGRAYAIPKDNPFRNEPGARPEIWALGLRNPWRYSFDRKTGELWVGDVGQNKWEEIDVLRRGGNYGWNRREGRHPFKPRKDDPPSFDEPVIDHGRDVAQSITGGCVYRGKKYPSLSGAYVYGDFMTGNIWLLRRDKSGKAASHLAAKGKLISSFGEDAAGEIYFTSFDGHIYAIRGPQP